jgi:hypothetical protein
VSSFKLPRQPASAPGRLDLVQRVQSGILLCHKDNGCRVRHRQDPLQCRLPRCRKHGNVYIPIPQSWLLFFSLLTKCSAYRTHLFLGKPDTPENRAPFISTIPPGHGFTPKDVANACCYPASDEAEFVTGSTSKLTVVVLSNESVLFFLFHGSAELSSLYPKMRMALFCSLGELIVTILTSQYR